MSYQLKSILAWVLRLLAAVIMLQTLFFKFTAAEESVYIFSRLGMEPWGRIGTGVVELIASVLILIPMTTGLGAVLGMGVMAGAIISHLTKLGVVVMHDGGQLFLYALMVFTCCAWLAYLNKWQLVNLFNKKRAGVL